MGRDCGERDGTGKRDARRGMMGRDCEERDEGMGLGKGMQGGR